MSYLKQLQSLSKLQKLGAASAFLLSFGYAPAYAVPISGSEIQLSVALLVFAAISAVAAYYLVRRAAFRPSLLRFGAVAVISGIFLVANWNGYRGLLLYGLWMSILAIVFASKRISREYSDGVVKGLIAGGVLLSMYAVAQLALEAVGYGLTTRPEYGGDVFGFARAQGFFEEPQFLASYLLLGLFLVVGLRPKNWEIYLAIITLGVSLTMSRGAAVGALVGITLLIFMHKNQFQLLVSVAQSVVIGLTLGLIVIGAVGWIRSDGQVGPAYFQRNYIRNMIGLDVDSSRVVQKDKPLAPANASGQSSAGSRFEASRDALERIRNSSSRQIMFGNGFSSYNADTIERNGGVSMGRGYTINNFYIEVLYELGVVGLAVITTWFVAVLSRAYRVGTRISNAALLALVAVMAQLLFFSSMVNNLHFWLLLAITTGLLAGSSGQVQPATQVGSRRRQRADPAA